MNIMKMLVKIIVGWCIIDCVWILCCKYVDKQKQDFIENISDNLEELGD